MKKSILVACLSLPLVGLSAVPAQDRAVNVVLILSDDTGYGEISAAGNPILKTPNLDRLYHGGTRLGNFHVAPTCAPTRAQLMTGNHEFCSGVTHTIWERNFLSLEAVTLPEVLKTSGYTCGIFGKWHLGLDGGYRPDKRGFDMALTQRSDDQNSHWDPIFMRNGVVEKHEGYRTDILFDEAMKWIEQKKDGPFFCYIPTYNAHAPLVVDEKYSKPYEDKGLRVSQPGFARGRVDKGSNYYGMIANVDENIGRLLKRLKALELDKNTVIIYATDNGHAMSGAEGAGHDTNGFLKPEGLYNCGMRGGKGQPWRGGSRVPCIFYCPGIIPADNEIDSVSGAIDILPTLADMCGAEVKHKIEGKSVYPSIKDPSVEMKDRFIVVHVSRWPDGQADAYKYSKYAIQSNRYRLVDGKELYDHHVDPGETKNVIDAHPELVKEMSAFYEDWWNDVRPKMINEERHLSRKGKNRRERD